MADEYWAEIKLQENKITFYTQDELRKRGWLEEIKKMQDNYKEYQQLVELNQYQRNYKIFEEQGVELLKPKFLALKGRWHWFTGHWHMDAFRLTSEKKEELEKEGSFTIDLQR